MKTSESQVVKEEFDLHVAHIFEMKKHFVENSLKVSGFLLLALGWYATSNEARNYLVSTRSVTVLASIAVGFAYILTVCASRVVYRSSRDAADRLKVLAYLPESAYKGRILNLSTLIYVFSEMVFSIIADYCPFEYTKNSVIGDWILAVKTIVNSEI